MQREMNYRFKRGVLTGQKEKQTIPSGSDLYSAAAAQGRR